MAAGDYQWYHHFLPNAGSAFWTSENVPSYGATGVFVLSVVSFVVASIVKNEAMDFMNLNSRIGNIGLGAMATLFATVLGYMGADELRRLRPPT